MKAVYISAGHKTIEARERTACRFDMRALLASDLELAVLRQIEQGAAIGTEQQ